MIPAAGVDMVEIDRIRKSIADPRFCARVFSEAEREYFMAKADPAPSAAADFAAKEAFSKALGTGIRGFSLCEVEALRDGAGAPYFRLSGRALAAAGGAAFSLSLTHTDKIACAFVIKYTSDVIPEKGTEI